MNYYDSIEKIIDYIEQNLEKNLSLNDLAKTACISRFHFHRIFSSVTGETVMKYMRKRRLTRASYDLINTEIPIIEIAFEYGYESQESFTKSFKTMFGTTPRKYRLNNSDQFLTIKSRINLEKIKKEKGEKIMNYKIVERKKTILIGMECTTCVKENKIENVIPKLWTEFDKKIDQIKNRVNKEEYFGICGEVKNFDPNEKFGEEEKFNYLAGVEVDSVENIPEGMKIMELPPQKYIVYTHKGELDKLQDTYKAIYSSWLPNTELEIDKAYDFEFYTKRFTGAVNPNSELDIYIPVK